MTLEQPWTRTCKTDWCVVFLTRPYKRVCCPRKNLTFKTAFELAQSYESAKKNMSTFQESGHQFHDVRKLEVAEESRDSKQYTVVNTHRR